MVMYKTFCHSNINVVIDYLNNNMIRKDDIVSLYYDGKYHVLVYNIERKYH